MSYTEATEVTAFSKLTSVFSMLPGLINTLNIINFVAYNITLLELRIKAGWQNGTCMLIVGSCSPNMPQISRGKIPKLFNIYRF